ncbi:MAG: flavodoxin family protein [Clostridiales bacterium]|nr:flavodoxin family protein [Clostridiales bacterium]
MKVLLINGSPHKNGCTYTALDEVAKSLKENGVDSEIVWIGSGAVHGCIACGGCGRTGRCVFDDGVNEISDKMAECDGLVVGSPVYYASPNGSVYSLLDRLFGICGSLAHKPAAAVVSARRGGTTAAIDGLNKYFTIRQMPVVSSTYWNMVHGSKPEDVLEDKEGLQTMRNLGRNMAWLIKCIDAGKKAGIAIPEAESGARTNFIR